MIDCVTPGDAWMALQADPSAQLVDVRTDAEWTYVGLPDLDAAGKQVLLVSWQHFPTGALNEAFAETLRSAGLDPDQSLFFICRSGMRSLHAAQAASLAGFVRVFNVSDGFEGPADLAGHRGALSGWKASGLPWRQG